MYFIKCGCEPKKEYLQKLVSVVLPQSHAKYTNAGFDAFPDMYSFSNYHHFYILAEEP